MKTYKSGAWTDEFPQSRQTCLRTPDVSRALRLSVEQRQQSLLLQFRQPFLLSELLEHDSSVLLVDRLADGLLPGLALQFGDQFVRQSRDHRLQNVTQHPEVDVLPILLQGGQQLAHPVLPGRRLQTTAKINKQASEQLSELNVGSRRRSIK